MLSDIACARLCYRGYWNTAKLDSYQTIAGVNVGLQKYSDCLAVIFPGTENLRDALADANQQLVGVPNVKGQVSRGFYEGLSSVFSFIAPQILSPVVLIGHSLGAARACVFGKMLEAVKQKVAYRVYGCPRPGDAEFVASFADSDIKSWKNNDDEITHLPPFPNRKQPAPFTQLACVPMDDDLWLEFRDHHFQLYMAGLALQEA